MYANNDLFWSWGNKTWDHSKSIETVGLSLEKRRGIGGHLNRRQRTISPKFKWMRAFAEITRRPRLADEVGCCGGCTDDDPEDDGTTPTYDPAVEHCYTWPWSPAGREQSLFEGQPHTWKPLCWMWWSCRRRDCMLLMILLWWPSKQIPMRLMSLKAETDIVKNRQWIYSESCFYRLLTHSMLMVEMESRVVYPAARKLFLYWHILMESSQSPMEMKRG